MERSEQERDELGSRAPESVQRRVEHDASWTSTGAITARLPELKFKTASTETRKRRSGDEIGADLLTSEAEPTGVLKRSEQRAAEKKSEQARGE